MQLQIPNRKLTSGQLQLSHHHHRPTIQEPRACVLVLVCAWCTPALYTYTIYDMPCSKASSICSLQTPISESPSLLFLTLICHQQRAELKLVFLILDGTSCATAAAVQTADVEPTYMNAAAAATGSPAATTGAASVETTADALGQPSLDAGACITAAAICARTRAHTRTRTRVGCGDVCALSEAVPDETL